MKTIILASKSPRRKSLLKQLGLKFTVLPSNIEEKFNPRLKPRGQAEALSLQKAESIKLILEKKKTIDPYIILSADTIAVINDEVLGKPKDQKDAIKMLKKLSGKKHIAITAFTIIDSDTKKVVTKSEETFVFFRKLNDKEIREYVKVVKPFGNAGSYAIQGKAAVFIEKIEGDFFNIVGLPLHTLAQELKKFGLNVF